MENTDRNMWIETVSGIAVQVEDKTALSILTDTGGVTLCADKGELAPFLRRLAEAVEAAERA